MSVRVILHENKPVVLGMAGAVALVSFGWVAWHLASPPGYTPPSPEPQAYFYDLHTGELLTAPDNTVGPIQRPGGPVDGHAAGVRAQVFACGQCSDASKRFIGWLEIDGPSIGKPPATEEAEAVYIRRVDDSEWYSSESAAGQKITSEALSQCGSGRVNFCRPEHEAD